MTSVSKIAAGTKLAYGRRDEDTLEQPVKGSVLDSKVIVARPYEMTIIGINIMSMHKAVIVTTTRRECAHMARMRSVIATIENVGEIYNAVQMGPTIKRNDVK
jgi:hypothetical protein